MPGVQAIGIGRFVRAVDANWPLHRNDLVCRFFDKNTGRFILAFPKLRDKLKGGKGR